MSCESAVGAEHANHPAHGLARAPISRGDAEKMFRGEFLGFGGLRRVPRADFLVGERANMENVAREHHSGGVCPPSVHRLACAPISRGETKERVSGGILGVGGSGKADFLQGGRVGRREVAHERHRSNCHDFFGVRASFYPNWSGRSRRTVVWGALGSGGQRQGRGELNVGGDMAGMVVGKARPSDPPRKPYRACPL